MCVIQSKFTKQTPIFFQNGGGGAPARGAGPGAAFAVWDARRVIVYTQQCMGAPLGNRQAKSQLFNV